MQVIATSNNLHVVKCSLNLNFIYWDQIYGSHVLKASAVKCWLISSSDLWPTSHWHRDLTLHQQLVDRWLGVDQPLIKLKRINQHMVACLQLLVDSWLTADWDANQVLTEMFFSWTASTQPNLQTNVWKIRKIKWVTSSQATSFKLGEYKFFNLVF